MKAKGIGRTDSIGRDALDTRERLRERIGRSTRQIQAGRELAEQARAAAERRRARKAADQDERQRATTDAGTPQIPDNPRDIFGRATKSAASSRNGRAALSAPMQSDADHKRLFGLNMARARKLADNMSQETLAGLLDVDRRVVNRWERGGREPRGPMRLKIAEKLGQSLDFFYDESVLEETAA